MKNTVVVLGAGASAPFGVPTLRHLFKHYHSKSYLIENTFLHDKLNELFWEPRGETVETSDKGLTVEDMLTVLRDYDQLGPQVTVQHIMDEEELRKFRRYLYVLIKKVIFDGKSSNGAYLNPIINYLKENLSKTTWASFNWDCIFESSFYYSSGSDSHSRSNPRVIVNLQNWANPSASKNIFLKLHGAINWWFTGGRIKYLSFSKYGSLSERWNNYENFENVGEPVILEPSYHKYNTPEYALLQSQWHHFINSLIEADVVIIIGYSLPEADALARTAFSFGFQSGKPNSKWIIVNKSNECCEKYTKLFGNQKLKIFDGGLTEFNTRLESILGEYYD